MSNNALITKRDFISKKGITIKAGEKVTVRFDVRRKLSEREIHAFNLSTNSHYCPPKDKFVPWAVSLNTADGRRVSMTIRRAGLRVPSAKLEKWASDSVVQSVFGTDVEPDGWSYDGSPSWLLALGLI